MNHTLETALLCMLAGGTAFADAPEVKPPTPPAPSTVAAVDPTHDDASATTATAPDAPVDPGPRYPRAVIERPLTLPGGMAQVGIDLGANRNATAVLSNAVAGFGLTDNLEVTAYDASTLRPVNLAGSLDVDVGYKLLRGALGGKLEVIGRARAGYNTSTETANTLRLGAQVQYNLTDTICVVSPAQQVVVGVARGAEAVVVQLPVGLGIQATRLLYVELDTTLASIAAAKSAASFVGVDATPLALTGIYNLAPSFDAIAAVSLDATPHPMSSVADSFAFVVSARYYLGD